ncbi:unnamed protein product, partial [Ectocarpus sp. 13 AM-2016]
LSSNIVPLWSASPLPPPPPPPPPPLAPLYILQAGRSNARSVGAKSVSGCAVVAEPGDAFSRSIAEGSAISRHAVSLEKSGSPLMVSQRLSLCSAGAGVGATVTPLTRHHIGQRDSTTDSSTTFAERAHINVET